MQTSYSQNHMLRPITPAKLSQMTQDQYRTLDIINANSHIPSRSHAVPLLCRAGKGTDFLSHIMYIVRTFLIHTCHAALMPCRAHAMPRPFRSESDFSRPRHSAAWARHDMCDIASAVQRRHVDALSALGFLRLPRGLPRSFLIRSVPIRLTEGLAVRIFPATMRNFTNDTALSKMAGTRHGMAGKRHGHGMACVN
jgi:hypothetical protein